MLEYSRPLLEMCDAMTNRFKRRAAEAKAFDKMSRKRRIESKAEPRSKRKRRKFVYHVSEEEE